MVDILVLSGLNLFVTTVCLIGLYRRKYYIKELDPMKYMTKECYDTMQRTGYHFGLRSSKQAEFFSEAYFKKLYKRAQVKWLKEAKACYEVNLAEVLPEEFCFMPVDGRHLTEAEQEEAQRIYAQFREKARAAYENRAPFDPKQVKKDFKKNYRRKMKELKENLPEEILSQVADIRVLALGRASAEVKKAISQYCEKNYKAVRSAGKKYRREYERQFKEKEPDFARKLCLHDRSVESCRKKGKDLLLTLEDRGDPTEVRRIRMKNCKVLKQDAPLKGARGLYEEIFKSGSGFEIHFLMEKNWKLIDFIVLVDDLEFEYD